MPLFFKNDAEKMAMAQEAVDRLKFVHRTDGDSNIVEVLLYEVDGMGYLGIEPRVFLVLDATKKVRLASTLDDAISSSRLTAKAQSALAARAGVSSGDWKNYLSFLLVNIFFTRGL